jgi:hypothetical protein
MVDKRIHGIDVRDSRLYGLDAMGGEGEWVFSMALARIQVSSASTGTSPVTLAHNPSLYEAEDSVYASDYEDGYGYAVYEKLKWDDRTRILRWEGYRVGSTAIAGIVNYFRSIEGQIRWFNFKDIGNFGTMNPRWSTSAASGSWKKARVVAVKSEYMPGGAFRYDNFEVFLQPEY